MTSYLSLSNSRSSTSTAPVKWSVLMFHVPTEVVDRDVKRSCFLFDASVLLRPIPPYVDFGFGSNMSYLLLPGPHNTLTLVLARTLARLLRDNSMLFQSFLVGSSGRRITSSLPLCHECARWWTSTLPLRFRFSQGYHKSPFPEETTWMH